MNDLVCSGIRAQRTWVCEELESQRVLSEGKRIHLDQLVIVTIIEAPLQILLLMSIVLVKIYEDVFGPDRNKVRIVEQRKFNQA